MFAASLRPPFSQIPLAFLQLHEHFGGLLAPAHAECVACRNRAGGFVGSGGGFVAAEYFAQARLQQPTHDLITDVRCKTDCPVFAA